MSIITEKLKFTGKDLKLKFELSSDDNFTGYQQEIDSLTQFTSLELVNPVVDAEKRKFKSANSLLLAPQIQFMFYSGSYQTNYIAAGYTSDEIEKRDDNFLNSFYILDFYNSFDPNIQSKIFTTYLTKLSQPPLNQTIYTISSDNQLYYWYMPVSYLELVTGNTLTGYVKFSFFNAKTGKLVLFYNSAITGTQALTAEKYYFKAEINKSNKSWKFISPMPTLTANEDYTNTLYINKVNATVEKVDNLKQNPPAGNTYDYNTNTYLTT